MKNIFINEYLKKASIKLMLAFFILINYAGAQTNNQLTEIVPHEIDERYSINQDKHVVIFPTKNSNDKLLLFIGGTGSKAINYSSFLNFASDNGYSVIGLSYLNFVSAMDVATLKDSMAFDNYRQEICFGTPLSDTVHVDSLNSIVNRATKLIQHLSIRFPEQHWQKFLIENNTINWTKVVIAGHSQGAGHSCYISKMEAVHKVIMFSGPNDYSTFYNMPALWLSRKGKTDTKKLFSYLSENDEVVSFDWQLKNLKYAGIDDLCKIEDCNLKLESKHILYTSFKAQQGNHGIPITKSTTNDAIWEYLLK